MRENELDFSIRRLGECRFPSPLSGVRFTRDDERVLYHTRLEEIQPWIAERTNPPAMEAAGPREKRFFDPLQLAFGIVTCGGLCPGINDVIRSIVLSLYHHYGVNKVFGFRFGYEGLGVDMDTNLSNSHRARSNAFMRPAERSWARRAVPKTLLKWPRLSGI